MVDVDYATGALQVLAALSQSPYIAAVQDNSYFTRDIRRRIDDGDIAQEKLINTRHRRRQYRRCLFARIPQQVVKAHGRTHAVAVGIGMGQDDNRPGRIEQDFLGLDRVRPIHLETFLP